MESHLKTGGELLVFPGKDKIAANQEMSPECQEVFKELKLKKRHRYLIFKMGEEKFEVEHVGDRGEVIRQQINFILKFKASVS
jgi:hypothetical protein